MNYFNKYLEFYTFWKVFVKPNLTERSNAGELIDHLPYSLFKAFSPSAFTNIDGCLYEYIFAFYIVHLLLVLDFTISTVLWKSPTSNSNVETKSLISH